MFSNKKNTKRIIVEFNLNEIEYNDFASKARVLKMTIPQFIQWFVKFKANADIVEYEGERIADIINDIEKDTSIENINRLCDKLIKVAYSTSSAFECVEDFKRAIDSNI